MKEIFCISILALFFLPSQSLAGDVYSWKDSSGRIIYGSRPPSSAVKKKSLSAKTFSTYSSNKLLKGYGLSDEEIASGGKEYLARGSLKTEVLKVEGLDSDDLDPRYPVEGKLEVESLPEPEIESQPAEEEIQAKKKTEEAKTKETFAEVVFQNSTGLNLELGDSSVIHDKENHIVALGAQIKNLDKKDLKGIAVGFAFENGSYAPALGPKEIGIGQSVDFDVPPDLLPIIIGNPATKAFPVVVIKYTSKN